MWNPRLTKITSRRSRFTMLYIIRRIDLSHRECLLANWLSGETTTFHRGNRIRGWRDWNRDWTHQLKMVMHRHQASKLSSSNLDHTLCVSQAPKSPLDLTRMSELKGLTGRPKQHDSLERFFSVSNTGGPEEKTLPCTCTQDVTNR